MLYRSRISSLQRPSVASDSLGLGRHQELTSFCLDPIALASLVSSNIGAHENPSTRYCCDDRLNLGCAGRSETKTLPWERGPQRLFVAKLLGPFLTRRHSHLRSPRTGPLRPAAGYRACTTPSATRMMDSRDLKGAARQLRVVDARIRRAARLSADRGRADPGERARNGGIPGECCRGVQRRGI